MARWPGECSACGVDFLDGDEVGYVDDELCCEECCDAHDAEVG